MTFEEFFKRCWFWRYCNDETQEYVIEVGVEIDPYYVYEELYEVTKEFLSDLSSKEIVARWFYDNLKKEKRI